MDVGDGAVEFLEQLPVEVSGEGPAGGGLRIGVAVWVTAGPFDDHVKARDDVDVLAAEAVELEGVTGR